MSVLGVDLGGSLGWVLGAPVGPMKRGTIVVDAGGDHAKTMSNTCAAFHEILGQPGIKGIAVEMPFMASSYYVCRRLLGQLGILYLLAPTYGIGNSLIEEVAVPTGKKALSGSGHADKAQMIAAAAALGYQGFTEHEADALGVWWAYTFGKGAAEARKARRDPGRSVLK